jgi:hypothetical protein
MTQWSSALRSSLLAAAALVALTACDLQPFGGGGRATGAEGTVYLAALPLLLLAFRPRARARAQVPSRAPPRR